MDTRETAEKTAPSAAPAKSAPNPGPGEPEAAEPAAVLRRTSAHHERSFCPWLGCFDAMLWAGDRHASKKKPEPEELVPLVPLSGPRDDSLEGLGAAFSGLSVAGPEGKEKEKEKEAVDNGVEEEDRGDKHDTSDEELFDDKPAESVPSASDHPAVPSLTTTTLPATHTATSSPTTTPPMAPPRRNVIGTPPHPPPNTCRTGSPSVTSPTTTMPPATRGDAAHCPCSGHHPRAPSRGGKSSPAPWRSRTCGSGTRRHTGSPLAHTSSSP